MKIIINNRQNLCRLNSKKLKKIIRLILKNIGQEKAIVGITFVDDKGIKELNKRYRRKNRPTDVLSFYLKEEVHNLLGDVVISIETAIRQAKDLGHSFEEELKILLIHGILHLLDYDHMKKSDFVVMEKKEKELLKLIENV